MGLENLNPILSALIGTGISFAGTAFGAAFVFFVSKKPSFKLQKVFLGFASGVMIAASVWSLLLPAEEYASGGALPEWIPMTFGFLAGAGFLFALDKLLPHHHAQSDMPEGPKSNLKKSTKLIFAVTLHNFPEGMAVGLAFALAGTPGSGVSAAAAFALAIGIAVQNLPEGAVIALPLKGEGFSKRKAFLYGALSGVAEPVSGVLGALIAAVTLSVIPWALSFAAGAMIYVVIDELVPGAASKHTDAGTLGAIAGFAVMMMLDIALG
ncbi:MAG: ZIP family metal transporter [Clostridiales bacterium]|jgi:ZIP family zinc transporter|nr:ZIP family metal transporter [Clostridiales bacterium]